MYKQHYDTLNGNKKELYTCKYRKVKVRIEDPIEERTYIVEQEIVGCGHTFLTCGRPTKCPKCHGLGLPKVESKDERKVLMLKIAKGVREI